MSQLNDYVIKVQAEMDDQSASTKVIIERNCKSIYQQVVTQNARQLVGTTTEDHTATVGIATYTTNNNILELVAVHYKQAGATDFTELGEISEQEYLDKRINLDNGTPYSYFMKAENVILSPTPSDAGTIRFTYVPVQVELTTGQTSVIPDRYEDVIVMGTLYRMFAYEKGPEALEYKQMFDEAIAYMRIGLRSRTKQLKVKFYGC